MVLLSKDTKSTWKGQGLVLIPVPPLELLPELISYLDTHCTTVKCIDLVQPSTYWYKDKATPAHTLYFSDETEATEFYLKWNGFATKVI